MSFKSVAEAGHDGKSKYVLSGMKGMNCDVTAFLSPDLFAATNEDVWADAVRSAQFPGAKGVYLMPDCHKGYVLPVGGVLVTDETIVQAGSGYDISCFSLDTQVSLVDGRELSFTELISLYGAGGDFYVYSMKDDGNVTAGKAHSPRITRRNMKLVEIELDNGTKTKCTLDHEWMMRDGSYQQAQFLKAGDSLMPLYRKIKNGYCCVQHPSSGLFEKMYKVSFREKFGYLPEWPQVIHHDIFNSSNTNPSKLNDDPRFLMEMNENDHFRLHAQEARGRAQRSEIGWGRLHQLKPEQMSRMSSENMTRLHADPDFRERHAKRMAETFRKVQARGGYAENWADAGNRGKAILVEYNQSEKGRAKSREIGLGSKGRILSEETRKKLREAHANRDKTPTECTLCGDVFQGPHGLDKHTKVTHTNPGPLLKCEVCGKSFKGSVGLHRHILKHRRENSTKCGFCGETHSSTNDLTIHVQNSHRNHEVVSVRFLDHEEDVACLTVEEYGNFALTAGVFVHNCGCVQLRVPGMHASDLADPEVRRRWVNAVERRVATGNHSEMPSDMAKTSGRLIQEVVRYGAKALGVSESLCERQYIPIPDDYDHKIKEAWNNATAQLGSVGGGNHFIELQVDAADGSVWIMVHCGSRAFGWKTADHFFKAGAELRGIQNNRREESYLFRDEPMGKDYWNAHNCAANYAIANRHRIVAGVNAATQEVFGHKVETYYEISHNLVQEETLVLPDGTETRGFVHRKGATRAFPAGHPELRGTKWADTGHPCLIPGSMLAGAAILFPLEGAYQSGCSVNHGSGRLLGRGEAKRELAVVQGDIDDEMNGIKRVLGGVEVTGIVGNCEKTPLDECGHVYKDLDSVLGVLVDNNIARIERRLYPVANLKGTE